MGSEGRRPELLPMEPTSSRSFLIKHRNRRLNLKDFFVGISLSQIAVRAIGGSSLDTNIPFMLEAGRNDPGKGIIGAQTYVFV
jgi:hypothetical protein